MRRDFLKLCSLAGLGLAAPVSLRAAETGSAERDPAPYEGPFYVVFNASGGWDTTYMMDPKGTEGVNRLYKTGDIQTHGQHHFAPIAAHIGEVKNGLSNEDFFKRYGAELLTYNGLDYSVNNHSPCSRYMATGELDNLSYPTFAALVAACRGPECPVAFLTFGNYSATGNLVPMARVPYLPSLKRLANVDGVDGIARHPYHDDFVTDRIDTALRKQHAARIAGTKSRAPLPRVERAASMLYAAQLNSKALGRVAPHIPDTIPKGRLQQQAEIALASFKGGVCVSANLSIGQFDSHANNDRDQMKLIPEFLGGIDYLMRRAEEMKIRDKLVVVMQSEMGRRPLYNKGNGKDHWSIGSIMFMGAGIRGNRVLGKTDGGQFPEAYDPKNALVVPKDSERGIRVRPEHIHTALRQLAGIADHAFCQQYSFAKNVPASEELASFWT